jgi:preprotein translocase subunit SecF
MNWHKYTKFYFTLSGLLLALSIFGIVQWGFVFGIEFTGGTVIEYQIENDFDSQDLAKQDIIPGVDVVSIQATGDGSHIFKVANLNADQKGELEQKIEEITRGAASELKFEVVGPSVGPELVKKTSYALAVAITLILLWVAVQFKSLSFGAAAVLAMLHDTLILTGSFAILGHFFGAEVDFLFVTAVLTTLSFSAHDTIVVFDRIREIRKGGEDDIGNLSNQALTETMVRSLNNSFTIIFMLVALLLLGGATIKWFAAALLIGTVLGTYSSPFVAVPLLNLFQTLQTRFRK